VTVTVTARPPTTTQDDGWGEWPPWATAGPPWGKGKGGRWGRRWLQSRRRTGSRRGLRSWVVR
jgi:hypothetical protein